MRYMKRLTLFPVIVSVSLGVSAEKIYESLDDKGVVNFSDRPSPGAEEINVKPNVVDVTPAPPIEPPTAPAAVKPRSTSVGKEQPELVLEGGVDGVYEDRRLRRNIDRARSERGELSRAEHLPRKGAAGGERARPRAGGHIR